MRRQTWGGGGGEGVLRIVLSPRALKQKAVARSIVVNFQGIVMNCRGDAVKSRWYGQSMKGSCWGQCSERQSFSGSAVEVGRSGALQ